MPNQNVLYLIYDGDCLLCRNTAKAIKIKNAIGHLELINARSVHPLVDDALAQGYDLNEGIVVKYQEQYFHGPDAIHFLALVGSRSNLFNVINAFLFRYKWLSRILYPFFKLLRSVILRMKNIPMLTKPVSAPLIQKLFAPQAHSIPTLLQQRYANRAYSTDQVVLKGETSIFISSVFRCLLPLFRFAGALVPYPAKNIPTTVQFVSQEQSAKIIMHRIFHYPDRLPYHFISHLVHTQDNVLIEMMRFRFAAKLIYTFENNKMTMHYGGYVFCLGKKLIPIPLGFLLGKFDAVEEVISEEAFKMNVQLHHFLFGKIFEYQGHFKIANPDE